MIHMKFPALFLSEKIEYCWLQFLNGTLKVIIFNSSENSVLNFQLSFLVNKIRKSIRNSVDPDLVLHVSCVLSLCL